MGGRGQFMMGTHDNFDPVYRGFGIALHSFLQAALFPENAARHGPVGAVIEE
jgi:hypothetical protein